MSRQRTPLRRLLKDKAKKAARLCCRYGLRGLRCWCDRWAGTDNAMRCECPHRPTQHRRYYRVWECTECDCRYVNPGRKTTPRFVAKLAKHAARVDRAIAAREQMGRDQTLSPYKR